MAPFRGPIDLFHAHTAPSDWYEGLVKAYVGDGMANDFYREIAAYLDPDTRDLVVAALEDAGHAGSSSTGCAPPSRPTRGSAAGWPCGAAG